MRWVVQAELSPLSQLVDNLNLAACLSILVTLGGNQQLPLFVIQV